MNYLFYSYYDFFSLIIFLAIWIASNILSYKSERKYNKLPKVLNEYRRMWMLTFFDREAKIVDVTIINTLRASTSFFASTSILLIAGFVTALASSEKGVIILSSLPFVNEISRELWQIKTLFLIIIFIYAFLEFTWSLRMYNFSLVLMGCSPEDIEEAETKDEVKSTFAKTAANVLTMASMHSNNGIRAYYFSMAALVWFIQPILMVIAGLFIAYILYNRDFKSQILADLKKHLKFYKNSEIFDNTPPSS